jgi:hypothetical protein
VRRASLPTPIVELYDEVHAKNVSREQKLAIAREFVAHPELLAAKFGKSVERMTAFIPNHESFYRRRKHYEVTGDTVKRTLDLALRLRDMGTCAPVAGRGEPLLLAEGLSAPGVRPVAADELEFEYLDRELVATRTTGCVEREGTAVRLDLLLADVRDRTPIVAEVKRTTDLDLRAPHKRTATDKDAFSALVQALACASQLTSPSQYARLSAYGREDGQEARLGDASPPTFDLFVVLHNRPNGTFLKELGEEAERLSVLLLAQPAVARSVRRIACLVTSTKAGGLDVVSDYAYERAEPPTAALERAFVDYFRPFALTLPDAAVLRRSDGRLQGRGWSARWRWRDRGKLEVRALHRMTNERWFIIGADGAITTQPVPPEMMVFGPGEDRLAVEAEYTAKWRAHADALERSGMHFDPETGSPLPEHDGERHAAFQLDGEQWQLVGLPPRPF